ncbi:hypothetical protein [Rhodovulum viride]|uniref:hypothetical protein n=1 Tax=Rhodovulum viride TaxID=1231134 RepID=UPI0011BE3E81|nr:hypothetical protein [Rhodovulum viride]
MNTMKRRFFMTGMTASAMAGCTSTTGTITQDVARRQRVLQASIIIGAGLGYAVARDRGGSALAGIAVGAFVGGAVASAIQYARLLLDRSNGRLEGGYDLSARASLEDLRVFTSENIPVLDRRAQLLAELDRPGAATRPVQIVIELEALNVLAKQATIPTPAYKESAEMYPETNRVMPEQPQAIVLNPSLADKNRKIADEAATILRDTVRREVARREEQLEAARRRGILIS